MINQKDRKKLELAVIGESLMAPLELVEYMVDNHLCSDQVSGISDVYDGDLVETLNHFRNQ